MGAADWMGLAADRHPPHAIAENPDSADMRRLSE